MNLTPNFKLEEFTFSQTAARKNIDNTPDAEALANLKLLAERMEDVRTLLANPIHISSGYRCLDLNNVLGSKPTSAHVKGLACDFTSNRFGNPNDIVFAIINSDIPYDKVIYEFGRWVHIAFCKDGETPRKQALTINEKGTSFYSKP